MTCRSSDQNYKENPMNLVIDAKGLVKQYKEVRALDRFDLEVPQGIILGLLGPNGSGKSTSIHSILSLLKIDEGEIKIFGKDMHPDAYDLKKRIGVVFQEVGVFDELTVYENIDYFCGLYVHDKQERKQLVQDAIDLVSLNDFVDFRPQKLSGGLLRRLNIACGISHKPELIFFDEPTVAVDPQSRNNILEGIKKLNEQGSTIIYTSHYMEEVELLCDYIVIIDKGKTIAQGTAQELKQMTQMVERLEFESQSLDESVLTQIKQLNHLIKLDIVDNKVILEFEKGGNHLQELIESLQTHKIDYQSLSIQRPTLNDVFLELTGKELRD